MTKLRRQSLTAYGAPLCETIVDCPQPTRHRGTGAHPSLRRLPLRPAHAGRLFPAGRRQEARRPRRPRIAVHARPRDRGRGRARRRGGRRREARRRGRGLSLDRLRQLSGLPPRRRKHLCRAAPSRHQCRRRLCLSRAGAASALPHRLRAASRFVRRDPDVLRPHRLCGARAARRSGRARPAAARRAWAASA